MKLSDTIQVQKSADGDTRNEDDIETESELAHGGEVRSEVGPEGGEVATEVDAGTA